MGEARNFRRLAKAKIKSLSAQTEAEMVDTTSIPGLAIKRHPEEVIAFREQLALPENKDLYDLGMKGNTFEECIAEIAAGLKIRLDGDYHPLLLLNVLTEAMKNRGRGGLLVSPYLAAADLKPVTKDMMEQDLLTLFDFGETYGTISPRQTGRGPYTICDDCDSSFDCISSRSCKLGKPAIQLENTMQVIDVVVKGKGRMH